MHFLRSNLIAAFAVFLLPSCAIQRGVVELTRPIVESRLAATAVDPDRLTPYTRAVLKQENLLEAFGTDPREALAAMGAWVESEPTPAQWLALVEVSTVVAERLVKENPEQALGYFLSSAEVSLKGAFRVQDEELRAAFQEAYNVACGRAARLLFDLQADWTQTARVEGPGVSYELRCRTTGDGFIDPSTFDNLWAAANLKFKGLDDLPRVIRPGFGAAMVGHISAGRERPEDMRFMSEIGMSRPTTVTIDFSRDRKQATLAFHEAMVVEEAQLAGRTVPLRADFTAPLATLWNFAPRGNFGWAGMLNPDRYLDMMGMFQFEPFRDDQIPLVFVHGLMSSPATWLKVANAIREDVNLRHRYQVLRFYYPSGFPMSFTSAALRKSLNEFSEAYDPPRRNPRMREMILIGHSMGGILSNVQIRDSNNVFVNAFFTQPIDEIEGLTEEQRTGLKDMFVYEANPDISRAVFMATPHRGSGLATNPIGLLGGLLIRFPMEVLLGDTILPREGFTQAGLEAVSRKPNSVRWLRPDNPFLNLVLKQPVDPDASYHSIIGRRNPRRPLERSSDGVVQFSSAHLARAASEEVVHASHTSITGDDAAIEEIRRILYLHAGMPYAPK